MCAGEEDDDTRAKKDSELESLLKDIRSRNKKSTAKEMFLDPTSFSFYRNVVDVKCSLSEFHAS